MYLLAGQSIYFDEARMIARHALAALEYFNYGR